MFTLRVTTRNGTQETRPLVTTCTIGRTMANELVLDGQEVSSQHCSLEIVNGQCIVRDHGSRNGTFLNSQRIQGWSPFNPGDRLYVGGHLIELVRSSTPISGPFPSVGPHPNVAPNDGSVLRQPGQHRGWRDHHGRLLRYARAWEAEGRASRLALRTGELRRAKRWLAETPAELRDEITALQREFILESTRVTRKQTRIRMLAGLGGFVVVGALGTAAVRYLPGWWRTTGTITETPTRPPSANDLTKEVRPPSPPPLPVKSEPPRSRNGLEGGGLADCETADPADPDAICVDLDQPIQHQVIPFETLGEIARRYEVSVETLASDNLINPDAPPREGDMLIIKKPGRRALPQTRITYEVDPGETWTTLADRFGIPVKRLQDYNPNMADPSAGHEIVVWIDPKPYKPRLPRKEIPDYQIDPRSVSVGVPNEGRLESGIQMPQADNLYTRRNPNIMWGSSFTIANLQKAVATFRQDVDFEGEVILADISQRNGGLFPPHKSHQAGRDIDIWLPTLKGVYKTKYLDNGQSRPRKPHFAEVDWYATWGLVRALIKTDSVEYIFLDWSYQVYVYNAAVDMGATPEELDAWIQYPRSKSSSKAIFRHSADHLSHIHVRFKCASWESECRGSHASE